jgi:transposase
MARSYKRKTQKASYTAEAIRDAVNRVVIEGDKIRQVSKETGIDKTTIWRYVKKERSNEGVKNVGYWGVRRVLDEDMELSLCDYLKNSARMYFGLSPIEVRRLAFELADKNNITVPLTCLRALLDVFAIMLQ